MSYYLWKNVLNGSVIVGVILIISVMFFMKYLEEIAVPLLIFMIIDIIIILSFAMIKFIIKKKQ